MNDTKEDDSKMKLKEDKDYKEVQQLLKTSPANSEKD